MDSHDDRKSYGEGEAVSEWKKRKTRSMVECDNCKALICWGKINGAKYDEYWQKGRKRLCPDCHKKYRERYMENEKQLYGVTERLGWY